MNTRDHHIGTRLTPSEYDAVARAADARGLKIAEWLRDTVVNNASAPHPVLTTLVEEILALRIIMQNVILYLTTDGKEIRKDSLAKLTDRADQVKAERALALVTRARTTPAPKR